MVALAPPLLLVLEPLLLLLVLEPLLLLLLALPLLLLLALSLLLPTAGSPPELALLPPQAVRITASSDMAIRWAGGLGM